MLVLPKFLRCSQARKANFLFLLVLAKESAVLGMLANARKDHLSPLIFYGHCLLSNEIPLEGFLMGSIPVPLSFFLYIKMTSTILSNLSKLILFAHDTNVFMSHKVKIWTIFQICLINLEMDKLSIWFKVNKNALTAA